MQRIKVHILITLILCIIIAVLTAGKADAEIDKAAAEPKTYEEVTGSKEPQKFQYRINREPHLKEFNYIPHIEEVVEEIVEEEVVIKTYYTVNGASLDYGLQEWALECLTNYGHPEYFPFFLAQMYQESSYDIYQVTDGLDYGVCQLRITSHGWFKQMSGRYDWDLCNSVYDNIECGAFLMSRYLTKNDGNIELALSDYFSGEAWWSPEYVEQVSRWFPTLRQINKGA